MFWFSCDCWALCKAMIVLSISGTLHKTPLDHVRGATRVVRSVWDLNPQTVFSVILISTCCAPRTNVLALVLSISTKARTMSVKDATLHAELVKVKPYTLLWPKKGYQNTCQGLSKHPSTPLHFFFNSLFQIRKCFTRRQKYHMQHYQLVHDQVAAVGDVDLCWGCQALPGPGWLAALAACCRLTFRVLVHHDQSKYMNSC